MYKIMLIANWKMNLDIKAISTFMPVIADASKNGIELIVCPPFVYISYVRDIVLTLNAPIKLAGQNCSQYTIGAYTGDVSAYMLKDIGCTYVILGHSETSTQYEEYNTIARVQRALENGLIPIVCIGEATAYNNIAITLNSLKKQIIASIPNNTNKIVIAYEPIWAIGSGVIPSIEEVKSVIDVAKSTCPNAKVVYGGSINANNAAIFTSIVGLDGLMLGGASLYADVFNNIVSVCVANSSCSSVNVLTSYT